MNEVSATIHMTVNTWETTANLFHPRRQGAEYIHKKASSNKKNRDCVGFVKPGRPGIQVPHDTPRLGFTVLPLYPVPTTVISVPPSIDLPIMFQGRILDVTTARILSLREADFSPHRNLAADSKVSCCGTSPHVPRTEFRPRMRQKGRDPLHQALRPHVATMLCFGGVTAHRHSLPIVSFTDLHTRVANRPSRTITKIEKKNGSANQKPTFLSNILFQQRCEILRLLFPHSRLSDLS